VAAGGSLLVTGEWSCVGTVGGYVTGQITVGQGPRLATQVWFCDWVDGGETALRRGGPRCAE
jgi:hypothetical protein